MPSSNDEEVFQCDRAVSTVWWRLFRGIVHTREGEKLRKSGGLSYTRLRELLLAKIRQLGWDLDLFGMHSLRAGGATAAANAGVPDRLFKRHGR